MNTPDSPTPLIKDGVATSTATPKAQDKPKRPIDLNTDRFSKSALKNARKIDKRCFVEDSPIHGKGLFAAKDIKAGISLGRLHGMLTEEDGTYVLWLNKRIGFEITNDFRFINHDSDPNCALTDTEVITLRDIKKGEEFTHDYGW